jgi:two-component system OmpR family sensor kinase
MDEAPGEAAERARMRQADRLHDVRTPLSVVVARVQLLRRRLRRGDDPARVAAELEALEAALVRLVATIERWDDERAE